MNRGIISLKLLILFRENLLIFAFVRNCRDRYWTLAFLVKTLHFGGDCVTASIRFAYIIKLMNLH